MSSAVNMQGKVLDLSSYDLEYSEVLALDWKKQTKQLELKFRLAAAGWEWKEKRIKFLQAIGLGALIHDKCVEYMVTINFLGVTGVVETLISQGHKIGGGDPSDTTWMKSFIFRIDDMRVVRRETTGFRFYLRTEDLELEFDFVDIDDQTAFFALKASI